MTEAPRRIVVGISGASGAVYGVRLLQALQGMAGVESHLVVSDAGWRTLRHELALAPAAVQALADVAHELDDVGAAIAQAQSDNLLTRAADVMLKERRRLVLLTRESPLHLGHLRNMVAATELGAIVCPPVPAFYQRPGTVDEIVLHSVARALDLLGLPHDLAPRWQGLPSAAGTIESMAASARHASSGA